MSAQRPVGRRDDAHVDFAALARAEHLEGAVLQHAQHLDLRRRIEIADLVEEDRAAVRDLEAALAVARASVNAPRTWPNISLSNSVDGTPPRLTFTNGLRGAAAVAVDGLGDELLAGAALAGDQDRGVGRRDAADQLRGCAACADRGRRDRRSRSARRARRASAPIRRPARACRTRPSAVCTVCSICWLVHGLVTKSDAPAFMPFDRQRDRSPRRDQDHRDRRRRLLDLRAAASSPSSPDVRREKFMSWMTS